MFCATFVKFLCRNDSVDRLKVTSHLIPDFSPEKELELLSYVAVKKFEQQQYVLFEQEEVERYIGEFLGIECRKSREVLQAIASQHGLLIERAQKV